MNSNLIGESLDYIKKNGKSEMTFEGMIIMESLQFPEQKYEKPKEGENQKDRLAFIIFPGEHDGDEKTVMYFKFFEMLGKLMKCEKKQDASIYITYFYDSKIMSKNFSIKCSDENPNIMEEMIKMSFLFYRVMDDLTFQETSTMKGIGFYVYY